VTDQIEDLHFETKQLGMPQVPTGSRSVASIVLIACIPLGVLLAFFAMVYTGAIGGTLIVNPGDVVTDGLPMATAVFDGSAAVTIGLLVISALALPGQRKEPRSASFSQWYATKWAMWAAVVWLISAVITLAFTAASVLGVPFSSTVFRTQFLFFSFQLELAASW
jgi:hypothetical protein